MRTIQAFQCEFCRRSRPYASRSSCEAHEERCFENPVTRSCATCRFKEETRQEIRTGTFKSVYHCTAKKPGECLADEIKRQYPNRVIHVFPDPSGKARKTSAGIGETDFSILRAAGFRVIAPPSAPRVADRINEVNALFLNAKGEHRLFIAKRCAKLIHCLEGLTYNEATMEPDKRLGLDHLLDALGYLIHGEFPLVSRKATITEFRI